MSILSKLTVTPLLYALGACLVIIAAQGAWLWKRGVDVESATSHLHVVQQDADTATRHVTELDTANKAWEKAANDAVAVIDRMRQDASDAARQNVQAILAAQKVAAAAEKSAADYHGKFLIESKKPDCGHALAAMQAACPALEGY